MNRKQEQIDTAKILVAAKRALIAADAEYFSWSTEQQERFRATLDHDARGRVSKVLLESVLGIQCTLDQVDEAWNSIPPDKLYQMNWASLLAHGIGEDYIYLNEPMAKDFSLLDFETLYEYDYKNHLYQEEVKSKDFPEYEGAAYHGWSYPTWIRLLMDDQFHYGTLISLAQYVMYEIESAGNDHISALIPHDYVEGPDNDKEVDGGFLWDIQIDAGGLEGQLDELKSRWWAYQRTRSAELGEIFNHYPAAVYIQDNDWDKDPQKHFIFSNVEVLKSIRWRHFLSDCAPFTTTPKTFEPELKREIDQAINWLTENHQEIMENFDPKVVKLQKKRKVIFAPEALDDLNKMLDDES